MVTKTTLVRDEHHDLDHTNTLGSLQLRNVETNEIILIPTPSSDPNDPLNWCVSNRAVVQAQQHSFHLQVTTF